MSGWSRCPCARRAVSSCSHARALNLLALGEEEAQSLGLPVQRTRGVLLVAGALVTGAAVAVSGLVGFVGLLVPHLVRLMLGGSDHRLVLPLCALGGALFCWRPTPWRARSSNPPSCAWAS